MEKLLLMKKGWKKSLRFGLFVSLASLMGIVGLTEIVFRIHPPTGIFSSGLIFDPVIGYRFRPYSEIIYNKRNGFVINTTNQYGWIDADHTEAKAKSQFRVGFFGDSYVESVMVPSEEHFFRNLPSPISGIPMEYFGFGMSGFGTVHSYLNSKRWIGKYDLDLIIYVFVENDIGDNISWIKKKKNRPYAEKIAAEPGFRIEKDFHEPVKSEQSLLQDIKDFIKTRSMLGRVIDYRIPLLKKRFTEWKTRSEEKVPNQNDLAFTWPEDIRIHAQDVAFSVLKLWSQEVTQAGKQFAVLYVPKGDYLSDDSPKHKIFKGWLIKSCDRLGIPLLDPSKAILAARKKGIAVYGDHWTPAGHAVLTEFMSQWLGAVLPTHFESMGVQGK